MILEPRLEFLLSVCVLSNSSLTSYLLSTVQQFSFQYLYHTISLQTPYEDPSITGWAMEIYSFLKPEHFEIISQSNWGRPVYTSHVDYTWCRDVDCQVAEMGTQRSVFNMSSQSDILIRTGTTFFWDLAFHINPSQLNINRSQSNTNPSRSNINRIQTNINWSRSN